jgi:two-component system cell cycle response regulator DivK
LVRILLIEDTPELADLIEIVLSTSGHTVHIAADGREGLSLAARHLPDLFLVDIQLPNIDGFEVLRQLRRHPALRSRPVIALTAFAFSSERERLLRAGFDAFIAKPIRPIELIKQIAEHGELVETTTPFETGRESYGPRLTQQRKEPN